MNRAVRYEVNNGVVTLKGDVPSQGQRSNVEKLAQQVPNMKQVVNELEVKNRGQLRPSKSESRGLRAGADEGVRP
jgi:osmotically-inducible protein OsmY